MEPFQSTIELPVKGQCTYLFEVSDVNNDIKFEFYNKNNIKQSIKFEINLSGIYLSIDFDGILPIQKTTSLKGLINVKGAFYWVSLDSQNQLIKFGIGEARPETKVFEYKIVSETDKIYEMNKQFLESMTTLVNNNNDVKKNIKNLKLLKDPIVNPVPLKVKKTDELTMDDVAEYKYLPHSFLTPINQKLYECISGKKFVLDDKDFPHFSKAIEYSIATEGCWCNTKLQEKSTEFNPDQPNISETYLRITLGRNSGESPGIPYVMEIWPSNHYSPIHSHANSNAIIRVLHGSINVSLFPFLSEGQIIDSFGEANFEKDDVTWLSPELNQIHRLKNINQKETCITIQCYMYGLNNNKHYDYFDYIDDDKKIVQYEPDSDMDFVEFKALMKKEWNERKKCFFC